MLKKLKTLKRKLLIQLIFVLTVISLSSCSLFDVKERIVYEPVEVPVTVETVKIVKQSHQCEKLNDAEITTWSDLLIAYNELTKDHEICLLSLD